MQIAVRCGNGASDGPSNHPRNRVRVFDCAVSCWSGFMEWCMSEIIEVKTSELTGYALDWAVAKAIGYECGRLQGRNGTFGCNAHRGVQYVIGILRGSSLVEELNARFWRPTTDWAQGGPLLDKYNVSIEHIECRDGEIWIGGMATFDGTAKAADAPLVAICRTIVAGKLGDVVRVPAELVVQ